VRRRSVVAAVAGRDGDVTVDDCCIAAGCLAPLGGGRGIRGRSRHCERSRGCPQYMRFARRDVGRDGRTWDRTRPTARPMFATHHTFSTSLQGKRRRRRVGRSTLRDSVRLRVWTRCGHEARFETGYLCLTIFAVKTTSIAEAVRGWAWAAARARTHELGGRSAEAVVFAS
jgi:hypothetical protein